MSDSVSDEALKKLIEEELMKAAPDWKVIEAATRGAVDSDPDSVRFSVDAAHIQRLGEQLVSKQETALSELIKNAFDADATEVTLDFADQGQVGGRLLIADNGSGMSEDVIRSSWMRISTNNKEEEPNSPIYRRVRAGRKGIGRFSVQRLGQILKFTTKPADGLVGFKVSFAWDEAFRAGVSLADVFSRIERFPKAPGEQGTELEILDLRDAWTPSAIERVWKSVVLLQAPFPITAPAVANADDPGFRVSINDTSRIEKAELFSIEKSFLSHALAMITAEIDDHGKATVRLRSEKLEIDDVEISDRTFQLTGPVTLEARYFIFLSSLLSGISQAQASAMGSEFGGVRVYRNGFRVQPYGQASDDWLDLAFDTGRRNLIVPANNFNFFGHVSISSEENPLFEETSSREGLIDNEAFEELKTFTRWALEWAALRVAAVRKRKQKAGEKGFVSLRVKPSDVVKDIIERHAAAGAGAGGSGDSGDGGGDGGEEKVGNLGSDFKLLERVVAEFEEQVENDRAASIEYEEMLRILASLGLSISVFGHEIKGAEKALVANIILLGDLIADISDADLKSALLNQNENLDGSASRLFDIGGYIAGLMSRTESRELRDLSVKGAIDRFVRQFDDYMTKQQVSFEVEVFPAELRTTPMHSAELDSVLLNFLTNSIKSMKRAKTAHRRVRISARQVGKRVEIAFEDNGVGIPEDLQDRIFDAFFTTTMAADDDGIAGPGTGLGLKIVSDIAESYGGSAQVGEPGNGYTCRMEFSVLAKKTEES